MSVYVEPCETINYYINMNKDDAVRRASFPYKIDVKSFIREMERGGIVIRVEWGICKRTDMCSLFVKVNERLWESVSQLPYDQTHYRSGFGLIKNAQGVLYLCRRVYDGKKWKWEKWSADGFYTNSKIRMKSVNLPIEILKRNDGIYHHSFFY